MIWDLALIAQVRSMRSDMRVANEAIAQAVDTKIIVNESVDRICERLVEGGHDVGVEIHVHDIVLQRWEEEITDTTHFRVRWGPSTNQVELRGGEMDGQHWEVPSVNEPFELLERFVKDPLMGDPPPKYAIIRPVIYTLAGWHEQDRHWMFDLQT